MATFKLSKDAKNAFKQKLAKKILVKNKDPPRFQLKRIKTDNEERDIKVEQRLDMNLVKQEDIKIESPTSSFDSDFKYENSSVTSETESKSNSIDSEKSGTITKPCQLKDKTKTKYSNGRRREPLIVTALRVHRYLSSRAPYSLTQKQLNSLEWAESVIMGRYIPRNGNHSSETIDITDDENDNSNFFNEAFLQNETITIPDTFQLAIVDFASPGGRYSLEKARLIEHTLSKATVKYILENPNVTPPLFGKSVYYDGVLVLDCKDQAAYEFAKLILWDIKLWDGSKLKMLEPQRTPFDTIACFHAPDVGIDKKKVLDILKAQNPSVNMVGWKMLAETNFKFGYKQYSIKISNPPVYFQKHKQLRLYFGGSEVILKLFGCEWLWNSKV